jgi:heavy metal sensor kinase
MALFAGTNTGSCYYVVWHRNGTVFGKSINAPATTPKPDTSHSFSGMRSNGEFREAFEATPPGECLLVGRTLEPELAELHQFAWTLSGIGGVILVLGLAGGWWLATGAIRPIAEISSAAANISAGDLSRRIDIADTDTEFGHLTAVLNSTFARLEAAFLQQGRFTADAAHELRTPVSVILLQVQTALKSERTPAEYRNALEACQRSANRMKTLMESLLELARLDAGQEPLRKKSFDITETVGECIDLLEPIAAQKGIKIHRTLEPATLQGDPVRLAQVFTNILNNAIHYNRENGTIQIGLKKQGGKVIVTVEDTGVGIAEEEIPKVFERFYRADKARSNINGHTGLGLSICKSIVSAHGGEIEVTSRLGVGTEFIVKLPDTGG